MTGDRSYFNFIMTKPVTTESQQAKAAVMRGDLILIGAKTKKVTDLEILLDEVKAPQMKDYVIVLFVVVPKISASIHCSANI